MITIKKVVSVAILFFFILALPVVGTSQTKSTPQNTQKSELSYSPPPDISKIKARGYITVAMIEKDQPPFFFTDDTGEFIGLDVKLSQGIATALGVELRLNRDAKSFNDLIPIVATGAADLAISKLSRTIARKQTVLFSDPYITFKQALMFNRIRLAQVATSDREIASFIKKFKGEIGVIANSSYVNYAKRYFPDATIIEFDTWDAVIAAVYQGIILAGYRDELEVKKATSSNSESSLLIKTVLLSDVEDNISIAIKWDSRHLLSWVNLYLSGVAKLDADALLQKYKDFLPKP